MSKVSPELLAKIQDDMTDGLVALVDTMVDKYSDRAPLNLIMYGMMADATTLRLKHMLFENKGMKREELVKRYFDECSTIIQGLVEGVDICATLMKKDDLDALLGTNEVKN